MPKFTASELYYIIRGLENLQEEYRILDGKMASHYISQIETLKTKVVFDNDKPNNQEAVGLPFFMWWAHPWTCEAF